MSSQETYLFEGDDGRVLLASVPAGSPAPTSEGRGVRALAAGESLPPASLSSAWRWAGDRPVEVDLEAAKVARAAQISATASTLSAQLAQAGLPLLLSGNAKAVAAISATRAALDAAPDLSAITDVAVLADYEPPAFSAARSALALSGK